MSVVYDKLIKQLHRYSEDFVAYKTDADFADAVQQAADAIEKLQQSVKGYEQLCDAWETTAHHLQGMIKDSSRWIPVTKRLPKIGEEVLIYLFDNAAYIAWRDKDGRWETNDFHVGDDYLPTAWMPLPEPPMEEI